MNLNYTQEQIINIRKKWLNFFYLSIVLQILIFAISYIPVINEIITNDISVNMDALPGVDFKIFSMFIRTFTIGFMLLIFFALYEWAYKKRGTKFLIVYIVIYILGIFLSLTAYKTAYLNIISGNIIRAIFGIFGLINFFLQTYFAYLCYQLYKVNSYIKG